MNELERFVPPFVRRWARYRAAPCVDVVFPVSGAVLSADIAGFTALTEQLARQGQDGIEAIQDVLNRCFAPVVEAIDLGGGEVVKFAGDATLAWWPATGR